MLTDPGTIFFDEPPHKRVDDVPFSPENSRSCVRVIGEHDGHVCQVNTIMGEVFDMVGHDRRYVGRSRDDESDLLAWRLFLGGMGFI